MLCCKHCLGQVILCSPIKTTFGIWCFTFNKLNEIPVNWLNCCNVLHYLSMIGGAWVWAEVWTKFVQGRWVRASAFVRQAMLLSTDKGNLLFSVYCYARYKNEQSRLSTLVGHRLEGIKLFTSCCKIVFGINPLKLNALSVPITRTVLLNAIAMTTNIEE